MRRWTPLETALGYRTFLDRMRETHQRHAQALDRSSALAGLSQRSDRLLDALSRDLRSAPSQAPHGSPVSDPESDASDTLDGLWCLGVGYVFEGSALGATLLLRNKPGDAWPSVDYLSTMSGEVGARWGRYRAALDRQKGDVGRAIDAAKTVFGDLVEALQGDRDVDDRRCA